jgi:hypothetical protein
MLLLVLAVIAFSRIQGKSTTASDARSVCDPALSLAVDQGFPERLHVR